MTVRLLTTNLTQEAGYAILRSLRKQAEHVSVGYYGAEPTDIARSRYVDASHPLPPLDRDLRPEDADAPPECSAAEERYVARLLEICEQQRIDTVLPTADSEVCVLSKNLRRLAEAGVRAPVPEWPSVLRAIDKHDVMAAAVEAGVPCPRSVLVTSEEEAGGRATELGFPLVAKARRSYFGRGVRLVRDGRELSGAYAALAARGGGVVLQEYVPGSREPSLTAFLGQEGQPRLLMTVRKLRYAQMSYSTCVESVPPFPELDAYLGLMRRLGLRGFVAVQVKRDSRDGRHKLLEVNLRLGANARILVPMALRRGLNPIELMLGGEAAPVLYPAGDVGVSPLEDLLALRMYLRARRQSPPADNPLPSLSVFLRSYLDSYRSAGLTFDWLWGSARRDTRCVFESYARNRRPLLAAVPDLIPWGELRGGA